MCPPGLLQDEIEREADFLYEVNRLNVAITRARAKVLLIYTEALLAPQLAAMRTWEAERCDLNKNARTAA